MSECPTVHVNATKGRNKGRIETEIAFSLLIERDPTHQTRIVNVHIFQYLFKNVTNPCSGSVRECQRAPTPTEGTLTTRSLREVTATPAHLLHLCKRLPTM